MAQDALIQSNARYELLHSPPPLVTTRRLQTVTALEMSSTTICTPSATATSITVLQTLSEVVFTSDITTTLPGKVLTKLTSMCVPVTGAVNVMSCSPTISTVFNTDPGKIICGLMEPLAIEADVSFPWQDQRLSSGFHLQLTVMSSLRPRPHYPE